MYKYEEIRPQLFTDEGQRMFLAVRDNTLKLLHRSGAVRAQEAMATSGSGDSWTFMACVDRMVELGEICEIEQTHCAGQHRVFVRASR